MPRVKLDHHQRLHLNELLKQAEQAMSRGQNELAVTLYQSALSIDPGQGVALEQLGLLMYKAGQLDAAGQLLGEAVAQTPRNVRALYMLGCVYSAMNQQQEAISAYERCIALKPDLVEAHNNLGVMYKNTEQFELAVRHFREVVKRQPRSAYALSNLGNVLKDAGYMHKALEVLDQAIKADPFLASAYSNLLITLNYLDDQGAEAIFERHQDWVQHVPTEIKPDRFRFDVSRYSRNGSGQPGKIRLGLVSPDLHQHSVAYFISPVFEKLDREQFELYVYYNNSRQDAIQQRFESLSDVWRNVMQMSEAELAMRIHEDKVDVLVDLAGHTANNRLAVFYQKPAPVQVSWLGYPNTSGLAQMDYRLVDEKTDPPGLADKFATETLLRLEQSFLCYSPMMDESEAPPVSPLPALENNYVTFGSFNNLLKLTGTVIETWAKILNEVADSKLMIKSRQLGNQMTRDRVIKRFAEFGISQSRLILHEMVPDHRAHLKLYNQVDIALDTFPYNGTTTTCEALWMGVPTLTLCGETHASRVGASLLQCVSMDHFVAESIEDYVGKAKTLSIDLDDLAETRIRLRRQLNASALCDQSAFMMHFEHCIQSIWQTHLAG